MYRKNLFIYFLVLQVLLAHYCYGQKDISDTLFNRFRNDIITEQKVNYGDVVLDDETLESYYLLLSTHSIDALIKYTNDSIPAVRAEIFSGLAQKNADEQVLRDILNKHLNDTAKFVCESGDVVMAWSVKTYMQTMMKWKADNRFPAINFDTRVEEIRNGRNKTISGIHHGVIDRDSLLKVDSLPCSIEKFKITSFVLKVRKKTIRSNSNAFTKRMKRNIKKLRSGERIYINRVKANDPEKTVRLLNSGILIIK